MTLSLRCGYFISSTHSSVFKFHVQQQYSFEDSKDSPTCHKESLRILLAIAASKEYEIESVDIMSAFLQGKELNRNVYVLLEIHMTIPIRRVLSYFWELPVI